MQVLIVGGGIAGPTLAYWLLRAGHRVALLERSPELRTGGYLIDFWGAGFDVAERMGLGDAVRERGYTFSEARAIDRNGRRIASFAPSVVVGPAEQYVSIGRSDLADVIMGAVGDDVELVLGDSPRTITDDGARVHVGFDRGPERDFDLVLGADGLHSRVRRLVFGPDAAFERYLGIVVTAFEAEGYRPRDELVAVMHAEVGFQTVRLSLDDDRTLFLLSVRHDGVVPVDDRAAQERLLRSALADGGREAQAIADLIPRAEGFYFDAVSQIRMPSWSDGRVALVGDAAACPSFLAGQGSALAMVEAYTLAAELGRSDDHRAAFDRYERRLATFLRSKQDAARGLGVAFAPRNRRQLFLRATAMRLMGLPKVADLVMGRSFHDGIELPEPVGG